MARILWHGISPYRRTGYGVQTRLFAPLIRDLGHDVVVCQMGHSLPGDLPEFDGIPIIGPGDTAYELPRPMQVRAAFGGKNPDLIWIFKDAWALGPLAGKNGKDVTAQYRAWNTAIWLMIDYSDRIGLGDLLFCQQFGGTPVAAARHGVRMLQQAGFKDPAYVPCGVDTDFWTPGDKQEARALLGLPQGAFIAGLNAQNLGQPSRKAFAEQFEGFAMFRARHSGALLLAHTSPDNPEGTPLRPLAAQLGITDAVKWAGHMDMDELQMRNWYRALDVYMNATYAEGFGLTICEAISCGTPAIVTNCSAMAEKITPGSGWLVNGQQFYVPMHEARWTVPSIPGIAGALEKAARPRLADPAASADMFDAQRIALRFFKPLLEELTA